MTDRINRLEDAFSKFGYTLIAEPSLGKEDIFADTLETALSKVDRLLQFNAKRYGYRGRSKKALHSLHTMMPNPCFGVEVTK